MLHDSSRTPCASGRGGIGPELGLHVGALGDRAGGRIVEVLAKVLRREVRERAQPDADAGDAATAFGGGDHLDPPDEILCQMLLVHASTSSVTRSAAAATAALSPLPNAKLSPSIP